MIDITTTPVQGEDVLLEVSDDNGDTWYKLVCQTKHGFEFTRNVNKTNTQCGQLIGKGTPEMTIPFEGAVNSAVVDEVGGYASYKKMQTWAKGFTALKARLLAPVNDGAYFNNTINCYLTDLKLDIPVDNICLFSGSLMGFGTWTIA